MPDPARSLGLNAVLTLALDGAARFKEGDTMSDPVGIAGNRIRSFVERIEQLDTELQEINEQKKEVFSKPRARASMSRS